MGFLFNNNPVHLHHFFEQSVDKYPHHTALICDETVFTYQALETAANQLAHCLTKQGIGKGSIVALLLPRSSDCYVAILAILKTGAAYLPLETEYPVERINSILADLELDLVITLESYATNPQFIFPKSLSLDSHRASITAEPPTRLVHTVEAEATDLCYIIYTSGSTGKPKGVEITHRSICHYTATASRLYAMTEKDRVYQGFSLAFDASLEELWICFANAATLIACTDKDTRSGVNLPEFLRKQEVTVLSTVPTLLASLEDTQIPLRLLILGGEVCTKALVQRWVKPGLTIMNTYGPTEATVIATHALCQAGEEVNLGKPLEGYSVVILDDHLKPLAPGEIGELCIGGLGLARGYVNNPTLTAQQFVRNPLEPTELLYKTGDLAFIDKAGAIHFAGRKDEQIKLRGFRIELNEIESVLLSYPGINQAVLGIPTPEHPLLIAYVVLEEQASYDSAALKTFLRSKLPDYMIPGWIEQVSKLPKLSSGKVDRKALPKVIPPLHQEYTPPSSALEKQLTALWESILQKKSISIKADFFYDLGGHSLLAAQLISSLRKMQGFAEVSIVDMYAHPTIEQLAKHLTSKSKNKANTRRQTTKQPSSVNSFKYYACGVLQLFGCLFQYGIGAWQLLLVVLSYGWFARTDGLFSLPALGLSLGFLITLPLFSLLLTVSAKWLLLGKIKPGEYPLWGFFYFRWWLVQGLQNNILQTKYLAGTPLIALYYRLLGAKIGKNCHIASTNIAVPDMLTMGQDCSIENEVRLLGYVVEDNWLKIGPIQLGDGCYVGARSVVGIHTQMEDLAVLDDMSMLPNGSTIAKGQFYTGSPATQAILPPMHITAQKTPAQPYSKSKTIQYGLLHYAALSAVLGVYYLSFIPSLSVLNYFYQQGSIFSTLTLGAPLAALLFLMVYFTSIISLKKLIQRQVKPGRYSLYSGYYLRQWMVLKLLDVDEIGVLADSLFFPMLLKRLGAQIDTQVEMGEAPQLIPDFLSVAKGGFAASGVALAWPQVYKGYITYGKAAIGRNAFIGNVSLLPQGSLIGEGGLLGCMTMPPSNNRAAQAHSYWLGSPPIYLPKREIMGGFPEELTLNPSKKLYWQRILIECFRVLLPSTCTLLLGCSLFYVLEYLLNNSSLLTTSLLLPLAELGINLAIIAGLIALKWVLVGKIKPSIKPLWDVFIWKNDVREFTYGYFINSHLTDLILGTPFIGLLYRAMGAKIGKRVFINTEGFAEFDLITIGDEVCINRDTLIQTHLYEDRIFKLGHLTIESGCTIGVGSMVLYDTTMEAQSSLGSFSLLMKGECLPRNTCWAGSPAQSANGTLEFNPPEILRSLDAAQA